MPENTKSEPTFEESLARLEAIVAAMEGGELGLDEMIGKFEEGQRLIARCQSRLTDAERRIEALVRNADGSVSAAPFDEQAVEA
jgi:exodeoxyribonuclease VII small subunit